MARSQLNESNSNYNVGIYCTYRIWHFSNNYISRYGKLNSKMLLYIALAFTVLFISMIFQVVLPLMSTVFPGDTDIFDITGKLFSSLGIFILSGTKIN